MPLKQDKKSRLANIVTDRRKDDRYKTNNTNFLPYLNFQKIPHRKKLEDNWRCKMSLYKTDTCESLEDCRFFCT